jgi:hypothetical protein
MIRLFIPDPDPDFLPILDPGSRGQKGSGSRTQNPDPQHCKIPMKFNADPYRRYRLVSEKEP